MSLLQIACLTVAGVWTLEIVVAGGVLAWQIATQPASEDPLIA